MTALRVGITRGGAAFSLPDTIVTATMAILAKKGAGKTYAAGVIEEEFAKHRLPFVVLDPVGVHYGLRSSADGKHEGYPVVVFGGPHADVPLHQKMGVDLARTIASENISAIIDLSELSKAAWREFVRDFCRTLFSVNKTPRHVFIEEATEFVPQRQMTPGMQETYEAVERMVRLGRNRGIGVTLIAQRSAQVAKDCLSQIDILIALRHTGLHDRNAITDAIKDDLDEEQLRIQMPEFKSGVTRLDDGEAWVWWPKHGIFEQIKVRKRETFHAGATPTFGKNVQPVMAAPDLTKLRERFKAVIEQREADDPKKLRAQIAQLKSELAKGTVHVSAPPVDCGHERLIAHLNARIEIADGQFQVWKRELKMLERDLRAFDTQAMAVRIHEVLTTAAEDLKKAEGNGPVAPVAPRTDPMIAKRPHIERQIVGDQRRLVMQRVGGQYSIADGLSSSQQKLLDAIAAFEACGLREVARAVVAAHAGVRHTTGSFGNNVSKLFTLGLIEKPSAGTLSLTDAGRTLAREPEVPATLTELHAAWRDLLSSSQAAILDQIIAAHPGDIGREEIADNIGVKANTGSFGNNLSKLRVLGIMENAAGGRVRATALLFPAGL